MSIHKHSAFSFEEEPGSSGSFGPRVACSWKQQDDLPPVLGIAEGNRLLSQRSQDRLGLSLQWTVEMVSHRFP